MPKSAEPGDVAKKRSLGCRMDRYNSKIAGIVGRLNGCVNYAVTISANCTLYSCDQATVDTVPGWQNHENAHKSQIANLGWWTFMSRYLFWSIKYHYQDMPFETRAGLLPKAPKE